MDVTELNEQTGTDNPLAGIDVGTNSSPYFVDIDDDSDLDLFIGNLEYENNILDFFENIGDGANPVFEARLGPDNPAWKIKGPRDGSPSFSDIDEDGDMDLFLGGGSGGNAGPFFENLGDSNNPQFDPNHQSPNPLDGLSLASSPNPAFADLDNDGNQEVIVPNSDEISYFEPAGLNSAIEFTEPTPFDPIGGVVNVGEYSIPAFVDIDGDQDMDAFVGNRSGDITIYENVGNRFSPQFRATNDLADALGECSFYSNAAPTFADIDNDGDFDCFVGSENSSGKLRFFKNTGTEVNPAFAEQIGGDNPMNDFVFPDGQFPRLVDLDNDGDLDMLVGNGDVEFFENTGTAFNPQFQEQLGANNPFESLSFNNRTTIALADLDNDGDQDLVHGEYFNSNLARYYENTGTADNPAFVERLDTANPFDQLPSETRTSPALVDINADGDFDLFMGESYGSIQFYRNNQVIGSPSVHDIHVSTTEEASLTLSPGVFLQSFTNLDIGAPLSSVTIKSLPANGSLSLEGSPIAVDQIILLQDLVNLQYEPNVNFSGEDSFSWTGSDGSNDSGNQASVLIGVAPVGDIPSVNDINAATDEDAGLTISVTLLSSGFEDPDGDDISELKIISLPANGAINLNGSPVAGNAVISASDLDNLVYTPNENYNGSDEFDWNASDGDEFAPENGKFTLTINPVNDLPIISDLEKNGTEGEAITFKKTNFTNVFDDVDGDDLAKIKIISLPLDGTLSLDGTSIKVDDEMNSQDIVNLIYDPEVEFTGLDNFSWNGSDGTDFSANNASVNINIAAKDDMEDTDDMDDDDDMDDTDSTTGVDEKDFDKSVSIYPNPFNNSLTVSLDGDLTGKLELRIVDIIGKRHEIIQLDKVGATLDYTIDFSGYNQGVYFIQLNIKNLVVVKRVIKN